MITDQSTAGNGKRTPAQGPEIRILQIHYRWKLWNKFFKVKS